MSKQDIWFIINPYSGTNKNGVSVSDLIEQEIDRKKYIPHLKFTEYAGHATEIAKKAVDKKVSFVVAVGGDGTVNEVAKSLINSSTTLGILPKGSGNGLARELGLPMNHKDAIHKINEQKSLKIDVGYINEIPFFCTAGIGFDAKCADVFAKGGSKRGLWNYIKTGFNEFWNYKPLKIAFAGNDIEVFSMTFANARQFGNNAYIAPQAHIDDGFLDCIIIHPLSMLSAPMMISSLFSGTIHRSKNTESYRGTKFFVEGTDNLLIHFDGEPLQLSTNKLKLNISEKCLKVII